nr:hypothetical protein R04B5.10 - Caenorhabditis elegans [Caenorhabditis elegans]
MNLSIVSQCANDIQMKSKISFLYRSNAYMNNVFTIVTWILTAMALKQLCKRAIFPKSTHVLMILSLIVTSIHELIYGIVQVS